MKNAKPRFVISNAIAATKPPIKASRQSTKRFGTIKYNKPKNIVINSNDTEIAATVPIQGSCCANVLATGDTNVVNDKEAPINKGPKVMMAQYTIKLWVKLRGVLTRQIRFKLRSTIANIMIAVSTKVTAPTADRRLALAANKLRLSSMVLVTPLGIKLCTK